MGSVNRRVLQADWRSLARWAAEGAVREPADASLLTRTEQILDADVLIHTARGRLDILGERVDVGSVRAVFDDWARGLADRPARLDEADGCLLRRSADGQWLPISRLFASAEALPLPMIKPADKLGQTSNDTTGIVIEGFDPPWLFERVWQATNDSPDGYRPELFVVQQDPAEFLDGLSLAVNDDVFSDVRVCWQIGSDASRRLARSLSDRLGVILPGHLLVTPGLRSVSTDPRVADVIRAAHAEQRRELEARLARVRSPARERSLPSWRDRFNEATATSADENDRLRVLIPTTRRSTYLHYAAHDLADGFRRLGHHAEVFETEHDHHLSSSAGLLRVLDRFTPDLVVVANYTRAKLAKYLPELTPFVCHLMDPMEHLFNDDFGALQGPTDFVVGHLYAPLFRRHGYNEKNAAFAFVPASASKFHDGPVDRSLAEQLACDIAYISHQSESPEQMHERMCMALAEEPRLIALMHEAWRRIGETFDPDIGAEPISEAKSIDPFTLALELVDGDAARGERFARMYAAPMAERFARHRVLEWSASIARKRGWLLRLYGRGWENHPTLSAHAAGVLPHDEMLRTAYRSARACLHISRLTNSHQRVFECALSGGLMLRRGPSPDFNAMRAAFYQTLGRCGALERESPTSGIGRYNRKRVPELYPKRFEPLILRHDWVAHFQRRPEYVFAHNSYIKAQFENWPVMPMSAYIDASLTDPKESIFTDPASLESHIERAIGDNDWRNGQIAEHRRYALSHATYDALASSMIALLKNRLTEQASEPIPAEHNCLSGAMHK